MTSLYKRLFHRPTELEVAEARLAKQKKRIRDIRLRNHAARVASQLEQLEADGTPFHTPAPAPQEHPQLSFHPVPVYETDEATGFPLVPTVHFEQDPIFGWNGNSDFGWDLGANVPINAFPRELFPDRPTTLRTQIAQDAIRFQSRAWYETCPMYSGPIGHLRNYIIGGGMQVDVTSKDDPDLATKVMEWIDEFAEHKQNKLHKRIDDSVLNLFRDGEDALRLFPGEEYPQIRPVDTSTIRGPHNEINGPWAYGILTSWPRDFEDVQAYHLWYPDNTHEDVSPEHLKLAKLDTTGSNVKRGVPLAYKIRKQLPQMSKLLDCMAVGEAARQAIPYIVQHQLADKAAVGAALQSSLDADQQYHQVNGGTQLDGDYRESEIEPGSISHVNKGQEYASTPQGYAHQGTDAYQSLGQAIANALNVPLWMVMATVKEETYASSLVAESPLVKLIQRYQGIITEHFEEVITSAVNMAIAAGVFPDNVWDVCVLHASLPSPVARNRKDEIEIGLQLLEQNLLSPQTLLATHDLEFDAEQELIKQAEQSGWESPAEAYERFVEESGGLDDNGDDDTTSSEGTQPKVTE